MYLQTVTERTVNHGLNINCSERFKAAFNLKTGISGHSYGMPEVLSVCPSFVREVPFLHTAFNS